MLTDTEITQWIFSNIQAGTANEFLEIQDITDANNNLPKTKFGRLITKVFSNVKIC